MGKTKHPTREARPRALRTWNGALIMLCSGLAVAQGPSEPPRRPQQAALEMTSMASPRHGGADSGPGHLRDDKSSQADAAATQRPRDARATLLAWADAWAAQAPDRYLAFYARTFQPANAASRSQWEAARRDRITKPRFIEVELAEIMIMVHRDYTEATFLQSYRSDTYRDRVTKQVELIWEQEQWKIRSERTVDKEALPRTIDR